MRLLERARHALPLQILLLILLVFLPACGKKGPVRPLLKAEPAAPGRPEARQVGGDILLLVDLPDRNLDGSLLTDLSELQIYRRETFGGVCAECDEPTELWRTVDLLTGEREGQRLTVRDSDVRPGFGYRYRLVPVTSHGHIGSSVSLSRQLYPFPPAPQNFQGSGFDRMVRLEWVEGSNLAPGWVALGCNLFRTSGDKPFGLSSLTALPLHGGHFDDIGPVNGILYRYQLRCLAGKDEVIVESPASAVVAVMPQME